MKMVAAAKVRSSETATKASRPYSTELLHMFQKLMNSVPEFSAETLKIKRAIDNYPNNNCDSVPSLHQIIRPLPFLPLQPRYLSYPGQSVRLNSP